MLNISDGSFEAILFLLYGAIKSEQDIRIQESSFLFHTSVVALSKNENL
jgi:hypothetical protein